MRHLSPACHVRARHVPAVLLCALLFASEARAVILYSSSNRNLAAPRASLAGSGWQWEGTFGGFLGTAISKKYIITASHFDAPVGTSFDIAGTKHRTVEMWDDPNSDLRIYKCVGTFPTWAEFVKKDIETNRVAMMIGRGTTRGDAVVVGNSLKGWKWGVEDHVQSWGRNVINGTVDGGEGIGQLLRMDFDASGVGYEGAYSRGDSGGGLFVKYGSKWLLAGVAFSSDGPYSTSSDLSNPIEAALFDRGGLWSQSNGFIADSGKDIPGASYASRILPSLNWISGVFNGTIPPSTGNNGSIGRSVPEPAGAAMIGLAIGAFTSLRRRRIR